MQRHEQVLPLCRCIAQIGAWEYVRADAIACRWGVGGEVINKIGRGAHLSRCPLPKLLSRFAALFLKAREAPSKKKKETDSKTANLILGETKG